MQQIEFKPLGRKVSCLGLGCARLDGRIGLRRSTRLLETALELGITYFDVAASYGTAEEALGLVVGASREVVVATKVGPPERPYRPIRMLLDTATRPVLDRMRGLKVVLRKALTYSGQASTRERYDFSQQRIERSIAASQQRLRRDYIDVFLAHEPNRLDLVPEVESHFQSLVERGLVGAFGVGIGASEDRWDGFGSIWQSGWPGQGISDYNQCDGLTRIFHGILRTAQQGQFGRHSCSPIDLLRAARRSAPNSVLLVSASTPARLRQLIEAVDEVTS